MLGAMLRLGCAILLVWTSFVAAAPRGKVVRIERPRTKAAISPILCDIRADLTGNCVGSEPRPGDIVSVISDQRMVAEVRILSSSTQSPQCQGMWNVKTEKLSGDLTRRGSMVVGVVDPELDRRAATVNQDATINQREIPNADPSTKAVLGVDRDGGGSPDIVLAWSSCGGAAGTPECFEIWSRRDRTMVRTWSASTKNCY
jgi:hypothetical protein